MVTAPYEMLLHQAGFPLAIEPLARMFELEDVTDPRLQYAITIDVIERTMVALQTLTKTRTLH